MKDDHKTTPPPPPPPLSPTPRAPDGGWGWVVVAASAVSQMLTIGMLWALSVLYVSWLEEFGQGKGLTSWVISLGFSLLFAAGPISASLASRFGHRSVVMAGGLMTGLGVIACYWATSVQFLVVAIGFFSGLGCGLTYVSAVAIVTIYFDRKRSLASGISLSGVSVGSFILAPLLEVLENAYGWRNTILILGALTLNLILCGAVMRPLEGVKDSNDADVDFVEMGGAATSDSNGAYDDKAVSAIPANAASEAPPPSAVRCCNGYVNGASDIDSRDEPTNASSGMHRKHDCNSGQVPCGFPGMEYDHSGIKGSGRFSEMEQNHCSNKPDTLSDVERDGGGSSRSNNIKPRKTSEMERNVRSRDPPMTPSDVELERERSGRPSSIGKLARGDSSDVKESEVVIIVSAETIGNDGGHLGPSHPTSTTNGPPPDTLVAVPQQDCDQDGDFLKPGSLKVTGSASDSNASKGSSYFPVRHRRSNSSGDVPRGTKAGPLDGAFVPATGGSVECFKQLILATPFSVNAGGDSGVGRCGDNIVVVAIPRRSKQQQQQQQQQWQRQQQQPPPWRESGDVAPPKTEFSSRSLLSLKESVLETVRVNLELMNDLQFMILAISHMLLCIAAFTVSVYMVDRMVFLGIDKFWASIIVSVSAAFNFFGRVFFGFASDRVCSNHVALYMGTVGVSGLATLLSPLCGSYLALHGLYAAVVGFCTGGSSTLTLVVNVDVIGVSKVASSYGLLMTFMGLGNLVGMPMAGWLFDWTRTYTIPYVVQGLCFVVATLMLAWLHRLTSQRKAANQGPAALTFDKEIVVD